jgi:general secretion pathway protein G
MNTRHEQAAFTLIELMIVVIIIAALAAMVAPNLMDRTDDAKAKIARGDISNIDVSLKLFRLDNGSYPTTEQGLEALLSRPGSAPNWKGPYLERRALDPWRNPYKYACPGAHNPAGFDLFSSGKDGQEGTADDVANWGE